MSLFQIFYSIKGLLLKLLKLDFPSLIELFKLIIPYSNNNNFTSHPPILI